MGGIRSGNFSLRRSRRGFVEHAVGFDIATLARAGHLCLGTVMEGQWRAAVPLGSRSLMIRYSGDLIDLEAASLTLSYQATGIKRHQTIKLAATEPHLGGTRLWFICPVTAKRARILYLPEGAKQFASREAHALAYRSQSEPALFRNITQAQNIRAHLNGDLSIYAPFPPRPRGMHQHTYDRLRAKALKIERCALESLINVAPRR